MTTLPQVLLDTDTLSLYLRKTPRVVVAAQEYLAQHEVFTFSVITRFEILRGMMAKNAFSQIKFFDIFCDENRILNLTDSIIVKASEIYADLYQRGGLIGDADILIAATALENGLRIITNNESHFARVNKLQIGNWLKTS